MTERHLTGRWELDTEVHIVPGETVTISADAEPIRATATLSDARGTVYDGSLWKRVPWRSVATGLELLKHLVEWLSMMATLCRAGFQTERTSP